MVDITNLETQLAAAIAGLTGSENAQDLMVLKKSCEGTSVDTTALDAAIQTEVDALSGASVTKDLLIANRASVESVGGGHPIGAVVPINHWEDRLELDGQTWLKTGVIETDIESYPDAMVSFHQVNKYSSGSNHSGISVSHTGGYVYVNSDSSPRVYFLDNDLNSVSNEALAFLFVSTDHYPEDITWDGTHYYVLSDSSSLAKATSSFSLVTRNTCTYSTSNGSIANDGAFIYAMGYGTNSVHIHDINSLADLGAISLTVNGAHVNGRSLAIYNGFLYVYNDATKRIHKFDKTNGGEALDTLGPLPNTAGLGLVLENENSIVIHGYDSLITVYRVKAGVGDSTSQYHFYSDYAGENISNMKAKQPYYVRIK